MEGMGRRRAVLRAVLGWALLASLLIAVIGGGLWTAIFQPTTDEPIDQADALLVLGPVDAKLEDAVRLMDRGAAQTLVVSDQDQREGAPGTCRQVVVDHIAQLGWAPDDPSRLLCFRPVPVTTQGEAMAIREFGEANGWSAVNVLAYPEHVSRARILVDRCWTQDTAYLAASDSPAAQSPGAGWDAFWYQSGALGKAALTPGCDTMLPQWLEKLSWRM